MNLDGLGRVLILLGALTILVGVALLLLGRLPWFGRLPGDIVVRRDGLTIFLPLATMIIVSIVGTILLNVLLRFFNRP